MSGLLSIEDLTIFYGDSLALSHITCSLNRGEILCVVGESGSGKSTLLQSVIGLPGSDGTIQDGHIFFENCFVKAGCL